MKRVLNSLKNWIDTDRSDFIRTFLLSEGFGFCLCISFIWGFRLDVYGGVSGWLIKSILLSLFFGDIVADILMFALLYARERGARRKEIAGDHAAGREVRAGRAVEAPEGTSARTAVDPRIWAAASCVIIACWVPIWLAYYPAVFAYDVETQLGQVISGPYSTHHPLLHTLIMGGCMKLMWNVGGINAGMALYAVLQMLFMGITGGWVLAEARRLGTSKPVLILYGAFLALFPVNGILAVSTTKDVIFSGLMLIELLLVRRILKGETCFGRGLWVKTAIATAALIIFRNNALYALVPTIVIYMLGKTRKRALVLTLAAGCLAGCLVNGGLKAALHAESGSPREALSIPIQQMARAYSLHRDELPEELRTDLEMCLGGDVTDVYDPHLADKVKKQVYLKDIRCFVKSWFKIIAEYPGDSFDAWLYTTEGAWYMGDTSANRIYGTGGGFGYLNTDTRSMPYGFEVTHRSFLPGLTEALEKAFSDNAFETVPVFRRIFSPALYVWILAAFLYVCLVRRDRSGAASLLIPGFVYLTILCGPAVLVRYMYPYMLMVIYPFIPNKETSKDTIPSVDSPETDER